MNAKMFVKAAPGLRMPKEGAPHLYITDTKPERVEPSHYYRKAVVDGDLAELSEAEYDEMVAEQVKADEAAAAEAAAEAAKLAATEKATAKAATKGQAK